MASFGARLEAALADRYRLEREIGAGGMAVVFLARDLRHDRRVALKVLRPELVAAIGADRFLREVRLTANLQHPHILPLHDSGEADGLLYYVMPFVEGEPLRTRLQRDKQLPVNEAIELTRQMAAALDYAHRQGVIHRDIKPENVLLHEGQALVTDFGIALALGEQDGARLTETGLSIGTPQYMSPEQATGEREIGVRSDIYSLGCVLYELLAGDPPHSGATAQAITARKLSAPVASLRPVRESVSPELDRVIARALARVPADRFATMAEFSEALEAASGGQRHTWPLRRWASRYALPGTLAVAGLLAVLWTGRELAGRAPAPRFASIAVLPLADRTEDSTQNYVVAGLTEELIADLARLERVDVISLASLAGDTSRTKAVDSLARELGVEAVVAGQVERNNGQLRTELRLEVPGQGPVWTKVLERPATELAALERDLAQDVAREIGGRFAESARQTSAEAVPNPAAHDLYLRGRYNLGSRTPEGLQNALDYFRQALALDPANAPAYAGLAQYYSLLPFYSTTLPAEAYAKAKAAALKAVELDPFLPAGHAALAYLFAYDEWDWAGAERAYRRSLALQPSAGDTHHALSRLLAARGRLAEAVIEAERAHTLDPLSLIAHANIGVIAYFGRDYAEAARRLQATMELDPQFPVAHWGLGLVHEQEGRYADAIQEFEKAMAIAGRGTNLLASLGHALGLAGRTAEAEQVLKEVLERTKNRPILGYEVAVTLVGLGRTGEALDWLERAYQERSTLLSYVDVDPRLDPLRASPRFNALLQRLHFGS